MPLDLTYGVRSDVTPDVASLARNLAGKRVVYWGKADGVMQCQPLFVGDKTQNGLFWAREADGIGESGSFTAGSNVKVIGDGRTKPLWGYPVFVRPVRHMYATYKIDDSPLGLLLNAGVNTIISAGGNDADKRVRLEDITTGRIMPSSLSGNELAVKQGLYLYLDYNNQIKSTRKGNSGGTGLIDVSSDIPAAGDEAFFIFYHDTYNDTGGYVKTADRTITGVPPTLSDLQAAWDKRPNQYCAPFDVFRFADAQTRITENDRFGDLRQFINTVKPSGFIYKIKYNFAMIDDEEIITSRPVKFEDGKRFSFGDNSKLALVA